MALVKDYAGIHKEQEGVLLNKDQDALRSYKHRKAQTKKVNEIMADVTDLKEDMLEIKLMLKEALRK